MSSRRSASEGTRIGTTERRWNRSSRNRALGDRLGEIAAGRRDDADVDMDPRRAADALESSGRPARAGSSPASRAACRRPRRDRACRHAPPRARRPPGPVRRRPRRRTAPPPSLSGAIAGALRTTNGPSGARRMFVDEPRRQFLAGAGGAGNQDARIGGAELVDDAPQVGERGEEPTMRLTAPPRALQIVDLALEARGLERPLGDQDQPVGLERLLDEVIGAELDRRHRRLDVAVAGDHHDRHVGMLLLDRLEQLQPVELRALQPDVEQDKLRPARLDRGERLVGIAREARAVALVLEDARDEFADVVFVVDDENVSSHQDDPIFSLLRLRRRRARPSAAAASSALSRRVRHRRAASPSSRSTPPPWSSKILTTIGRPSPVPSARVVT